MNKGKTVSDLINCQTAYSAPSGLCLEIMTRISVLERRTQKFRLAVLGCISIASLVAVIMSFYSLGRALAHSGTFEYFSLFADTSVMTTYWKEAAFSLVESLPFLSLAMLLGVFGLFIWSGTKAWSGARQIMRAA